VELKEAIVLRSLDYKDSSKILYLYTDEGLKSVIAHNVKKMNSINRVLSQNGNLIKLNYTKSDFPSLKEGELVNDYPNIRKDLVSYTYMNHIMELIGNTIPTDSDHLKLYSFVKKIFLLLDQEIDPEILSFIFELKLLYFLGYGLNFKECSICSSKNDLVFSVDYGGLVCSEHLNANQYSYGPEIYKNIMVLYFIDINTTKIPLFETNDKVIIRHILDILYADYVSYKTKSRGIIKQIQKY